METGIETGTETGICDHCGEHHNIDTLTDVNDGRYTYCDNCTSEFCSQCDHCGDYYLRMTFTWLQMAITNTVNTALMMSRSAATIAAACTIIVIIIICILP